MLSSTLVGAVFVLIKASSRVNAIRKEAFAPVQQGRVGD